MGLIIIQFFSNNIQRMNSDFSNKHYPFEKMENKAMKTYNTQKDTLKII